MSSSPASSLRRYLLSWALGVLVVVWLMLIAFAWSTAFREARYFSDGQMTAVAKLWLTATPFRLDPHAPAVAPDLQHEYLQDVAVLAWDDGRLVVRLAHRPPRPLRHPPRWPCPACRHRPPRPAA